MNRALGSNRAEYSRIGHFKQCWQIAYVVGDRKRTDQAEVSIRKLFKTAEKVIRDLHKWADQWDAEHSKKDEG